MSRYRLRRPAVAAVLALAVAPGPTSALTLEEAVAAALAKHDGLAAAAARETAAEAGVEAAFAGYLPRLDLLAASRYGWIDLQAESDARDGGYWENEGRVQLRQRLWDNGRTGFQVAAAEAALAARGATVEATAERVALDTVEAFLAVLESAGLGALAAEELAAYRAYRRQVREEEAAGLLTTADRLQLDSRLALAEADFAAEAGREAVARARLASLLGWMATDLRPPAPPLPALPRDAATALQLALRASPLLAEAVAEIDRRSAERAAADTGLLPTVDLVLLGRAAHELDGLEGSLLEFVALVELRWTLYDGYGTQAETRRLSSLTGAATAAFADRRRRLAARIEQTLAELEGLEARLPPLIEAARAQRATLAGYRQQFDLGERSLLALLDARRELARLERLHLQAEFALLRAAYRLAHAMGGLRAWIADPLAFAGLPAAPPPAVPATAAASRLLLAERGATDATVLDDAPPAAVDLILFVGRHGSGPPLATLVAERLP